MNLYFFWHELYFRNEPKSKGATHTHTHICNWNKLLNDEWKHKVKIQNTMIDFTSDPVFSYEPIKNIQSIQVPISFILLLAPVIPFKSKQLRKIIHIMHTHRHSHTYKFPFVGVQKRHCCDRSHSYQFIESKCSCRNQRFYYFIIFHHPSVLRLLQYWINFANVSNQHWN